MKMFEMVSSKTVLMCVLWRPFDPIESADSGPLTQHHPATIGNWIDQWVCEAQLRTHCVGEREPQVQQGDWQCFVRYAILKSAVGTQFLRSSSQGRDGGTGRRSGLKIRRGSPLVGVRPPLPAPSSNLIDQNLPPYRRDRDNYGLLNIHIPPQPHLLPGRVV